LRAHAIINIRELMCEDVRKGRLNLSHRIDVSDEAREPVVTVRFAEAVSLDSVEEAR
jgi:hypothetical protein